MWDGLFEAAHLWSISQPAVVAQATPGSQAPQACGADSYGEWELDGEERWLDGQWVMQRLHYKRILTDGCNGAEIVERKTEGPFRLFQAVPDQRIAEVNRPVGSEDAATGGPLRSSEPPHGSGPATGSRGQPPSQGTSGRAPTGRGPLAPYLPSLALVVGLLVAWAGKDRYGPLRLPGSRTGSSGGGAADDWTKALTPLAQAADRDGLLSRIGDRISRLGDVLTRGWTRVRSNPVGWILIETVRRGFFVTLGIVHFVGTTVESVAKLGGAAVTWLAKGTWNNIVTLGRFITGDDATREEILTGFVERWFTKDSWTERWEATKFFGAMFAAGIADTWKRFGNGVVRLVSDPEMSNDDLIQLGDDTASVFCDALIVAEGVGAAVRAVRGASWLGRAGELSEFGKLGRMGQFAEAYRIAGVLSDAGYRGITAYRVWRVMKAAEREVEFAKLLSKLPESHYNTVYALIEQGYLQWKGSKLKGVAGTIKPWNLAKALASGQARDVDNLLNQIQGGLGEQVVREFMRAEPGFKDFLLDFGHSSEPGLDALAEFHNRFVAVEVKHWSSTVGLGDLDKYFEVVDGNPRLQRRTAGRDGVTRMAKQMYSSQKSTRCVTPCRLDTGSLSSGWKSLGQTPTRQRRCAT